MKVTYDLPTAIVSYTRLCLKIICELKRQQARLCTLLAKIVKRIEYNIFKDTYLIEVPDCQLFPYLDYERFCNLTEERG